MRFFHILKNDIQYQARYGFYFIYIILTGFYIAILNQIPDPIIKKMAGTLIILSDPAVLGYFFIGGIWLLEKEEGLHSYTAISPLKNVEYVLSKAISLGIVSTCSATIIAIFAIPKVNLLMLVGICFLSSCFFTLVGLLFATFAQTVNGYLLLSVPPAILLLAPSILGLFGIKVPFAAFVPGTMVFNMLNDTLSNQSDSLLFNLIGLIFWTIPLFVFVLHCVAQEFRPSGRKKYAVNT